MKILEKLMLQTFKIGQTEQKLDFKKNELQLIFVSMNMHIKI